MCKLEATPFVRSVRTGRTKAQCESRIPDPQLQARLTYLPVASLVRAPAELPLTRALVGGMQCTDVACATNKRH